MWVCLPSVGVVFSRSADAGRVLDPGPIFAAMLFGAVGKGMERGESDRVYCVVFREPSCFYTLDLSPMDES